MEAQTLADSLSYNVMGEITGQIPNEVVVIGGVKKKEIFFFSSITKKHTDSWDVGQGAMDDGGGVFVSWEAVRIAKILSSELGIKPLRTIRVVGWTNEENGASQIFFLKKKKYLNI